MKKVLLVDDSEENIFVMEILLEGHPFKTVSAKSGNEAFKILQNNPFDIVISDLEMDNGNGFWLMEKMTALSGRPHVIILSGNISVDEREVKSSGANIFFRKPYIGDELVSYISKI